MCDPITLSVVALGSSMAQAGANIYGQIQQRNAEKDYRKRLTDANVQQMQENRDLATKAYLDQAGAANAQLAESREAAAASNFEESRKANEARGAAVASAAEAGVYGVSLSALLGDFNRHEAMFAARNEQNLVFRQQQTARAVSGYHSEAQSRTASIRPIQLGPLAPVDYIGPMLQVVQSGANTGMNYHSAVNKGAKTNGG